MVQKISLNKTIKKLLRDSLGISERKRDNKAQFKDLFGVWSQKDLKEFEHNTKDFEKIDGEDWKLVLLFPQTTYGLQRIPSRQEQN